MRTVVFDEHDTEMVRAVTAGLAAALAHADERSEEQTTLRRAISAALEFLQGLERDLEQAGLQGVTMRMGYLQAAIPISISRHDAKWLLNRYLTSDRLDADEAQLAPSARETLRKVRDAVIQALAPVAEVPVADMAEVDEVLVLQLPRVLADEFARALVGAEAGGPGAFSPWRPRVSAAEVAAAQALGAHIYRCLYAELDDEAAQLQEAAAQRLSRAGQDA